MAVCNDWIGVGKLVGYWEDFKSECFARFNIYMGENACSMTTNIGEIVVEVYI